MKRDAPTQVNIGSAKSPIDFGKGWLAYKRDGHWRYYDVNEKRRRFVKVTDHELILELETRGYQILHPAHECIDRPNLPCPACEGTVQQSKRTAS